jgi:Ca2+-binding EF-hand superfamily protein
LRKRLKEQKDMNTFVKSVVVGALTVGMVGMISMGAANADGKGKRFGAMKINFEKVDANADGFVTKEEIKAQRAAHFAENDTDGDGALSKTEMKAAFDKEMAERAAKTGKQPDAEKLVKMEKHFNKMFRTLDENGDGKVDLSERPDVSDKMFAKVDKDNDGKLSKAEVDTARAKMKEHKKKSAG